jgi:hypothetical protein
MNTWVHVLPFVLLAFSLFLLYGAWFRNWGEKHYSIAKKYPSNYFLLTFFGENKYAAIYKTAVTFITILIPVSCILEIINWSN